MFFIDWVSNYEILKQLLKMEKIMSNTQEKIDAGEEVDLTELTLEVNALDDLNPDDTGTDTGPVTE